MTRTTDQYLALITPEHAGQPNFEATVHLSVDPLARMRAALQQLVADYDLDTAVGLQLDAVGVRVGITRFVPYPLRGLFFSLDDPARGLDQGVWKGPFDVGSSIYRLDDDTYRRLLRTKILVNSWDGTLLGAEAIFDVYFSYPATRVFVSDDAISAQPRNFFSLDDALRGLDQGEWAPDGDAQGSPSINSVDMVMTVGFAGKIPSIIDLALLNEGLIGPKPAGVSVDFAVTSLDGAPLFGLDMANDYIAGLDAGAWGVSPAELLA